MCLITKKLPTIAENDIECYKWIIKKTTKKNKSGFFNRLFKKTYDQITYETPFTGSDVTDEVINNKVVVARGLKVATVVRSGFMDRISTLNDYVLSISFKELENYVKSSPSCAIKEIEFKSGMIHSFIDRETADKFEPWDIYDEHETLLFKCIIPKGTLFAVGIDNDLCSEQIKIVECVKICK